MLADRKWLVITFPSDGVWIGAPGLTASTGYKTRGSGRGDLTHAPVISLYSSRKQFLRGQYSRLGLLDSVPLCATEFTAVESVASLEMA